jgi:RNA polymerase sigma-70 factor (TIGR02943 family)
MGSENEHAKPNLANPEQWVEQYGDYLYAFALSRVRDGLRAEDLVQETFVAALKANFAGASSEKSWLAGILKNKIMDYYRKAGRERSFTDMQFTHDESGDAFEPDGHWAASHAPVDWPNPTANLEREEFLAAFERCAAKLPRNVAQVFMLREVDDVDSKEVCEMLNISPNNLWVMLHRARMALRRCLELNWFGREGGNE